MSQFNLYTSFSIIVDDGIICSEQIHNSFVYRCNYFDNCTIKFYFGVVGVRSQGGDMDARSD